MDVDQSGHHHDAVARDLYRRRPVVAAADVEEAPLAKGDIGVAQVNVVVAALVPSHHPVRAAYDDGFAHDFILP